MREVTRTVYSFEELSDKAKEKARAWYRESIESDELTDYDDWDTIATILGVDFDQKAVRLLGGGTRYDPAIYWSLGYCQGDYAAFEGRYAYAKGAAKRIRQHAPTDAELHRIADDLQAVQKRYGYRLEARATTRGRNGMDFEIFDKVDECRAIGGAEQAICDALRRFAAWIYNQIRAQNDYLTSDEAVDESILANEYEFEADGSRTRD